MRRREFFLRMATSVSAAGLASNAGKALTGLEGHASRADLADQRHRIGISTWSLHNYFQATREKEFTLPGKMLELLDFPEMIADRYKVHHLEFCAPHFTATELGYLRDLKSRLQKTHAHVVNMPVDIDEVGTEGGLSDTRATIREAAIAACKKWIDIGSQIGTRAVRCDPGKMNPQNLAPTIESYKALAAYGKSKGVRVIVENHGGVGSEHPEELVKVFKDVNNDFFGALPDFANFPDEPTRRRGLQQLFPYAHVVCHAKGLEFDSSGKETRFDFADSVAISRQAGFKGIYSIEYEGPGDPYVGVQKTLDELMLYL